MALNNIFTGMAQGPEKINDNFNEINGRIPDVGDWVSLTMRNGFNGIARVRSTKYPSGKKKVDIYMEVKRSAAIQGEYMCDFPAELLPKREIPLTWAQPNNNDFDKVGASVGGGKTSIRLNYVAGGPSNLVIIFNLSYWLDV